MPYYEQLNHAWNYNVLDRKRHQREERFPLQVTKYIVHAMDQSNNKNKNNYKQRKQK